MLKLMSMQNMISERNSDLYFVQAGKIQRDTRAPAEKRDTCERYRISERRRRIDRRIVRGRKRGAKQARE